MNGRLSRNQLLVIGAITGFGSALTGTGGPVVLVPILVWCEMPILAAVGLSQAIQMPIALLATSAIIFTAISISGWDLLLAAGLTRRHGGGRAGGTPHARAHYCGAWQGSSCLPPADYSSSAMSSNLPGESGRYGGIAASAAGRDRFRSRKFPITEKRLAVVRPAADGLFAPFPPWRNRHFPACRNELNTDYKDRLMA